MTREAEMYGGRVVFSGPLSAEEVRGINSHAWVRWTMGCCGGEEEVRMEDEEVQGREVPVLASA